MATKVTSVKVIATDTNNNEVSETITHANPNASDYVLKTLGEKYNALSNNTLKKIYREEVTDITDAEEG